LQTMETGYINRTAKDNAYKENSVEHRWHLRKAFEGSVVVYTNEDQGLPCRTRDISIGGLFVETGPSFLAQGTPLKVVWLPEDGQAERIYQARAVVTHRTGKGVGVMFYEISPALYDLLRDYTYGAATVMAKEPTVPVKQAGAG